jgi:hypothetical protein
MAHHIELQCECILDVVARYTHLAFARRVVVCGVRNKAINDTGSCLYSRGVVMDPNNVLEVRLAQHLDDRVLKQRSTARFSNFYNESPGRSAGEALGVKGIKRSWGPDGFPFFSIPMSSALGVNFSGIKEV